MSLTDASFQEFRGRLRRIASQHADGRRFEAPGTVGAPRRARPERRGRLLLPLVLGLALLTSFKAAVHVHEGAEGYAARLAALAAGGPAGRAGAILMAADPVTRALAGALGRLAGPAPR